MVKSESSGFFLKPPSSNKKKSTSFFFFFWFISDRGVLGVSFFLPNVKVRSSACVACKSQNVNSVTNLVLSAPFSLPPLFFQSKKKKTNKKKKKKQQLNLF